MKPTYIEDSKLMELISEIANKIVLERFGNNAIVEYDGSTTSYTTSYTDEAQDFFNETYDEVESMFDTYCGIISDTHILSVE